MLLFLSPFLSLFLSVSDDDSVTLVVSPQYFACLLLILLAQITAGALIYFQKEPVSDDDVTSCLSGCRLCNCDECKTEGFFCFQLTEHTCKAASTSVRHTQTRTHSAFTPRMCPNTLMCSVCAAELKETAICKQNNRAVLGCSAFRCLIWGLIERITLIFVLAQPLNQLLLTGLMNRMIK